MSRGRHHHSAWQCFADVMMCMFAVMTLMLSLLLISETVRVTHAQDGVKPKAEYLVTLTWNDKRDVDLDLWLQTPDGTVIFYANRESPNVSLDRDSRGFATNRTTLPDGRIVLSGNQEVMSIRAIIPGDYIAAVNYYGYGSGDDGSPIDCKVTAQKVNPNLVLFDEADAPACHLDGQSQSINVLAFHVAEDGSVSLIQTPPVTIHP